MKTSLRRLIQTQPDMFYSQVWYDGESFMDVEVETMFLTQPDRILPHTKDNTFGGPPKRHAVELAYLYTLRPKAEHWNRWLWTRDADQFGHIVYVGIGPSGLFEIHRHLRLNERWGYPQWLDAA